MREKRGPIDLNALQTVERVFQSRLNGLINNVEYNPHAIDPVELQITLDVGFEADSGRFDVQWWLNHGYKYHYSETDLEFLFGWDRRPTAPEKQFHPPAGLDEHRKSCIRHEEPELVTLAVIKCWWDALTDGDLMRLNSVENPP